MECSPSVIAGSGLLAIHSYSAISFQFPTEINARRLIRGEVIQLESEECNGVSLARRTLWKENNEAQKMLKEGPWDVMDHLSACNAVNVASNISEVIEVENPIVERKLLNVFQPLPTGLFMPRKGLTNAWISYKIWRTPGLVVWLWCYWS
ncbi:hypothetical protein VNO77_03644 [Canavalia gladiata]|uniref:Uncharacterized protein n=1 Tax=Canavalia gladiata TaxID=3824 RepID=A0AAN9MV89_CANGL